MSKKIKTSIPQIVWCKGRPPHVGWWNASTGRDTNIWRWWNGRFWSFHVTSRDTAKIAADRAERLAIVQDRIEWNDRWPKNARVPRVNPKGSAKLSDVF